MPGTSTGLWPVRNQAAGTWTSSYRTQDTHCSLPGSFLCACPWLSSLKVEAASAWLLLCLLPLQLSLSCGKAHSRTQANWSKHHEQRVEEKMCWHHCFNQSSCGHKESRQPSSRSWTHLGWQGGSAVLRPGGCSSSQSCVAAMLEVQVGQGQLLILILGTPGTPCPPNYATGPPPPPMT